MSYGSLTLTDPRDIGYAVLIALAKLTTPGTLLRVDSLGPSLSPHAPAVVAVTSVLADVYLTVMKWLTSDQSRAARPTWKGKRWSIGYAGLSHEPRTDQLDSILSADRDTCRRRRFFIVTDHVDGQEEKSDGQGDVLGRVCGFCGLEHRTCFVEPTRGRETEPVKQKYTADLVQC